MGSTSKSTAGKSNKTSPACLSEVDNGSMHVASFCSVFQHVLGPLSVWATSHACGAALAAWSTSCPLDKRQSERARRRRKVLVTLREVLAVYDASLFFTSTQCTHTAAGILNAPGCSGQRQGLRGIAT